MVGMGGSSKSGTSDEPIDTKFIPVFGGAMLGIGALLFGLSGLIILLPEPQYSAPKHKFEMLTPDEAAKAAHERLAKDGSWSTDKYGNTIYIAHKPLDRNKVMPKLEMLSSIEASKAARARLARSGAESFSAEEQWMCWECGDKYPVSQPPTKIVNDSKDPYGSKGITGSFCSNCSKGAESFAYESEELIPIGTKVRSYDFWPHDKTCYKEGVIVDHAPSPSCSPGCMHYHIRTTKVVRRGKSRPVEEGEIFMTHPYADPWDQEYPGQLAPHIQSISTAFPSTSTI